VPRCHSREGGNPVFVPYRSLGNNFQASLFSPTPFAGAVLKLALFFQISHELTWRGIASLSRNQKVPFIKKLHNLLQIMVLQQAKIKNTHKKQEVEGL